MDDVFLSKKRELLKKYEKKTMRNYEIRAPLDNQPEKPSVHPKSSFPSKLNLANKWTFLLKSFEKENK